MLDHDHDTNASTVPAPTASRRRGGNARAWLIAPVAGAGLFMACLVILATRQPPSETVNEVRTKITDTLLHRSTKPGVENGGPIGPWWVSASEVDSEIGTFHNLRITSNQLHIAAEAADLTIDPVNDTFTFELRQVVLFNLDDVKAADDSTAMRTIPEYSLGPIEYGVDIVNDEP